MQLVSSHPLAKSLEGQEFLFNPLSKVIILEINEPFYKAGKILSWDIKLYGSAGFGINKSIIDLILRYRAVLLIRHNGKEYWSRYDKIDRFILENNTEYRVNNSKYLHVLSWKIFTNKPIDHNGTN